MALKTPLLLRLLLLTTATSKQLRPSMLTLRLLSLLAVMSLLRPQRWFRRNRWSLSRCWRLISKWTRKKTPHSKSHHSLQRCRTTKTMMRAALSLPLLRRQRTAH